VRLMVYSPISIIMEIWETESAIQSPYNWDRVVRTLGWLRWNDSLALLINLTTHIWTNKVISVALSHLTRSPTPAFSTIAQIMQKKHYSHATVLLCKILQELSQCHVISSTAIIILTRE
jgi:hypothetical protein